MFRRQFWRSGRACGVIIDRCKDHGVWLDRDELERILGFLSEAAQSDTAAAPEATPGLEEILREHASRPATPRGSRLSKALSLVGDLLFDDLLG